MGPINPIYKSQEKLIKSLSMDFIEKLFQTTISYNHSIIGKPFLHTIEGLIFPFDFETTRGLRLLKKRCFDNLTFKQIGESENLSRERCHQIVRKILRRIEYRYLKYQQQLKEQNYAENN